MLKEIGYNNIKKIVIDNESRFVIIYYEADDKLYRTKVWLDQDTTIGNSIFIAEIIELLRYCY